jgi:hypothetical protein
MAASRGASGRKGAGPLNCEVIFCAAVSYRPRRLRTPRTGETLDNRGGGAVGHLRHLQLVAKAGRGLHQCGTPCHRSFYFCVYPIYFFYRGTTSSLLFLPRHNLIPLRLTRPIDWPALRLAPARGNEKSLSMGSLRGLIAIIIATREGRERPWHQHQDGATLERDQPAPGPNLKVLVDALARRAE